MEISYDKLKEYLLQGRELHFYYKDKQYSISNNRDGWYLTEFYSADSQAFLTTEDLLTNGKIDGKILEEIWDNVIIDVLF